jgi:transcriptional regulator with XRE-family HTH domain
MQQTATYSMIVAQLLSRRREELALSQADFFERSGLTQSTWSRINRGLSLFTLEEMRAACQALNVDMPEILGSADRAAAALPRHEDVEVLENLVLENLKGSENKSLLPTIIAGAALAFLIARILKAR